TRIEVCHSFDEALLARIFVLVHLTICSPARGGRRRSTASCGSKVKRRPLQTDRWTRSGALPLGVEHAAEPLRALGRQRAKYVPAGGQTRGSEQAGKDL